MNLPVYYVRPLVYIAVDQRKKLCQKSHFFMYVFLKVNFPAIKLLIYLDKLNIYLYVHVCVCVSVSNDQHYLPQWKSDSSL